jgi:hypothetical protein
VSAARTPAERAARLLRWYPRAWRDRYGEEFTELVIYRQALSPPAGPLAGIARERAGLTATGVHSPAPALPTPAAAALLATDVISVAMLGLLVLAVLATRA